MSGLLPDISALGLSSRGVRGLGILPSPGLLPAQEADHEEDWGEDQKNGTGKAVADGRTS